MEEKGVSPMIATIVLIFIVFAIAGVLIASIASSPRPTTPFGGTFVIENAAIGKDVITVKHTGGDVCYDAFDYGYGYPYSPNYDKAVNLEVRLNGVVVNDGDNNIFYAISEGAVLNDNTPGVKLITGDLFKVKLPGALARDDKIALIYVPTKQLLMEITIT